MLLRTIMLSAVAYWCVSAPLVAATEPQVAAAATPTIVQNQDEPGRSRYQQSMRTSCQYAGDCALVSLAVPYKIRRVVEHVSCGLTIPSSGSITTAILYSQAFRPAHDYLPISTRYTSNYYYNTINVNTLVYFVPQEQPRIDAYSYGTAIDDFDCTLSGYDVYVPS